MKKIYYSLIAILLTLGACHPTYVVQDNQPSQAPVQQQVPVQEVSYQNFYDELSPYGHWINYPGYGYVWMPAVGPDFKPYATNGYWIYTDMGWTWTSNYNWGWAPFHYGRWFYEGGYGWMWVPGNEWSPAWVSWRSNNDYYGWAPLGPNVRTDVYGGYYNPPSNYWCFVPHQYISSPRVNNYYVNETRNVTIINNTTIINARTVNVTNNNNSRSNNNARTVYVNGPDRQEVERATGSVIRPAVIRENNRPGEQVNNGQYTIYRPRVNANATRSTGGNQSSVAPSRVESLRDIRPVGSSVNTNPQGSGQPVIRNNSITPAPSNNITPSNSNTRPSENLPASNVRPQQNTNSSNQPVNNRNNSVNEVQPVNRTNTNSASPANNNQPVRPINTRSNAPVGNNNNNTVANPSSSVRPADARPPVAESRPENNNARANTPANNASANTVRTNTNTVQNKNKSAEQINQMRKKQAAAAATNANNGHPLEKKEEKKEKKDE